MSSGLSSPLLAAADAGPMMDSKSCGAACPDFEKARQDTELMRLESRQPIPERSVSAEERGRGVVRASVARVVRWG